jgi:hypothetical protein
MGKKPCFCFLGIVFLRRYPNGYTPAKTMADMLRNVTKAKRKPFFKGDLLLRVPHLARLGSQRAAPALWQVFLRGFFGRKRTGATEPSPAQQSKK